MSRCLISFGANIGQPAETIRQAAQQLQLLLSSQLRSFELSRLYRTPAVGGPAGQPPFVNAVAALELEQCTAWDVWHVVRKIEQTLGRVRQERWEARRIDLDVLLFDDQRIWTQHFKLPHPRMVMRRFILEPAVEVARLWREPVSGMTIGQLTDSLRRGMASIALIADDLSSAQTLLENAAGKSQSAWLVPSIQCDEPSGARKLCRGESAPEPMSEQTPPTRWLGIVSMDALRRVSNNRCDSSRISSSSGSTSSSQVPASIVLSPRPQLVFVLAASNKLAGAAWEDVQRPLACWLGLTPGEAHVASWPLAGPRYLLSTDDPNWAEHEIIAALEAMDCPVEPLEG